MNQQYVGAVDQGTTGTRFVVFDHTGEMVSSVYETHEQVTPNPGWVEHDVTEIWENAKAVTEAALERAGIDATRLAAIGVTNQRETVAVWDAETGEPVHNALVWQDRRTTGRIDRLEADGRSERIRARTGLEPDAYFSASKVEWILDNADGVDAERSPSRTVRDRAEAGELMMGTIDSWLVYKLTGNHITDVTNASRTMLYNINDLEWDRELLDEFNVPEAILPEIRPSSDDDYYGYTDSTGFLGTDVPVTGALGDQQAALFGQTCFDEGDAKNTYGTGSFMLMNTGDEPVTSEHGLLTTIGFQRSGEPVQYALEGAVFVTGAAIEWLEDVSLVEHLAEVDRLGRAADSTGRVYLVPAFTGLGSPYWDPYARGTLLGLTRGTRREHVVRAALESIGYQTRDIVEAMEADFGGPVGPLRVDGGAVKNDFLCQLQADITDTDIVRPVVDETTALGAAYAAGLAVGYWDTVDELRDNWQVDREFEPDADADYEAEYERWNEAVARAEDWARS